MFFLSMSQFFPTHNQVLEPRLRNGPQLPDVQRSDVPDHEERYGSHLQEQGHLLPGHHKQDRASRHVHLVCVQYYNRRYLLHQHR